MPPANRWSESLAHRTHHRPVNLGLDLRMILSEKYTFSKNNQTWKTNRVKKSEHTLILLDCVDYIGLVQYFGFVLSNTTAQNVVPRQISPTLFSSCLSIFCLCWCRDFLGNGSILTAGRQAVGGDEMIMVAWESSFYFWANHRSKIRQRMCIG